MKTITEHYSEMYLSNTRWLSYIAQIASLEGVNINKIAEIGIGPNVMNFIVKKTYPDCKFITIDINPDLKPDFVASVLKLPFQENEMDATFCCQVLEHIPYEMFVPALKEIVRITKKRVVISIPDITPFFYLRFRGSRRLLNRLWKGINLPHLFTTKFDKRTVDQHFWEIGYKGYSQKRIQSDINSIEGIKIVDQFRLIERPYWHFFYIEKQN